ncbi:hypothetical protein [Bradyrhizobium lablabi]|uniref:hypothetical protein n=1 Tax=Bradyrhizobium lablabi TaxID=722472 RepID=UPI001BAE293D|nr:hypothetical protein [Bradyrhizobium lablabi]MBR0694561.1 hypothetical protein [Bradyrhizobium lablabi]
MSEIGDFMDRFPPGGSLFRSRISCFERQWPLRRYPNTDGQAKPLSQTAILRAGAGGTAVERCIPQGKICNSGRRDHGPKDTCLAIHDLNFS